MQERGNTSSNNTRGGCSSSLVWLSDVTCVRRDYPDNIRKYARLTGLCTSLTPTTIISSQVAASYKHPRDTKMSARALADVRLKDKDNPTAVLAACRDDIVTLWEDPVVQGVLKKHNTRIQDMPGLCVGRLLVRCAC